MGHVRLGNLPKTRPWLRVVALIAGGAHAPQVATATVRAAERILARAFDDAGLVETVWRFLRLPLAARTGDLVAALGGGVPLPDRPSVMDILGAFTERVDHRLPGNCGRTDLGEMAQMAAVEAYAAVLGPQTQGLFGSDPETVQRALAALATVHQVSLLGHRFFARLMYKFLDFYLSRTLADHVGEGQRFANLKQVADFTAALETYCGEAAVIVERFSGEWFSKHNWGTRNNITRKLAAAFGHGAMQKLIDELKQGINGNG